MDATAEWYRLTGVDLTAIPGLGAHTILKILSEIGLDMTTWPSAQHFGSWLGLAPNNRVSGGKVLSRRTRPTANRAATALRVVAQTLRHAKSALGAFLRRKAAHLGMPKAITATAYQRAHTVRVVRVVRSLSRRANDLGYQLVKNDPAQALATAG